MGADGEGANKTWLRAKRPLMLTTGPRTRSTDTAEERLISGPVQAGAGGPARP